jgi:hypothetical protein
VVLRARDGTIYGNAFPIRWYEDCGKYCVGMNLLDLWAEDCGLLGHPGDIEGTRAVLCAPSPGTPRDLWELEWFMWTRHEDTCCEYEKVIEYGQANVRPDAEVAKDKHGTHSDRTGCPSHVGLCGPFPVPCTDACGGGVSCCFDNANHRSPVNLGEVMAPLNDSFWIRKPFFDTSKPNFTVATKRLAPVHRFVRDLCGRFGGGCPNATDACDVCDETRVVPIELEDAFGNGDAMRRIMGSVPGLHFSRVRATNFPPAGTPETIEIENDRDDEQVFEPIEVPTRLGNALRLEYLDEGGSVVGCMNYVVGPASGGCLAGSVRISNLHDGSVLRPENGQLLLQGFVPGRGAGLVTLDLDDGEFVQHLGSWTEGHSFLFALPVLLPGGHRARITVQRDYGSLVHILVDEVGFAVE